MRYLVDDKRHLICQPFSISGLHEMARTLGIKRCWYHAGRHPHYDVPKLRVGEIGGRPLVEKVSTRELYVVIRESERNKEG